MRSRRIFVAALLIVGAIIAPCTAWYLTGSRAAEREAVALETEPFNRGWDTANGLAERLAGRLESIRGGETRRPYYHYAHTFHDPTSTCSCASVAPSPLSDSPSDPLVRSYFQIDSDLQVILPSLDDGWALPPADAATQEQLRDRLGRAAAVCFAAVETANPRPVSQSHGFTPTTVTSAEPIVGVGDLVWVTVPLDDEPFLAALRAIESSAGTSVQGFLVATDEVNASLRPSDFPVRFAPERAGAADAVVQAPVYLDGAECDWAVELDVGSATLEAMESGRAVRAGFQRSFLVGSSFAGLAGLLVVWLLWQTEQVGRQRSRFAASAAHELRTPLAGMRLYSEMLAENLGDPDRSQDYARKIADESERLGRVVTNVLGFSRLERGALTCNPTAGNIGEALEHCLTRLRPAIEHQGCTLNSKIAADLPPAMFDAEGLFHVVQNLVDNAEKYSRGASIRTIDVDLGKHDDRIRLSVTDHGPGVPNRLRGKLFEPFARGDQVDAPAGLGLGLALVRSLARAQDAKVGHETPAQGGARFNVDFRRAGSNS